VRFLEDPPRFRRRVGMRLREVVLAADIPVDIVQRYVKKKLGK
jgi:hypothetical protein